MAPQPVATRKGFQKSRAKPADIVTHAPGEWDSATCGDEDSVPSSFTTTPTVNAGAPRRMQTTGIEERSETEHHDWPHSRLSSSALRRQRRQRASNLATQVTTSKEDQKAGEVQVQAKVAPRNRVADNGKGNGKSGRCEQLMEDLEAGGKARTTAVAALRGSVVPLAFDSAGCRTVQLGLQVADRRVATELAAELRGNVCEAIRSPHANYVIQKVIEVLPMAQATFIADELRGMGVEVARHRYGCRILCRLLEHSATDAGPMAVFNEVLQSVGGLCRHSFGHYVIQSILEHGTPEQRHQIAVALRGELARSVQNRNACYVIENALSYCSADDRQALVEGLLDGGPSRLSALAQHQFGSHVVRALLRLTGETSQLTLAQLRTVAAQLQMTKYGRRLLEDFGITSRDVSAAKA